MEPTPYSIHSMLKGFNLILNSLNRLNRYCSVYDDIVRYCVNPEIPATEVSVVCKSAFKPDLNLVSR